MKNYNGLNEKIRVNFFSAPKKRNSKSPPPESCAHLGTITWDGFTLFDHKKVHRIQCSKCGKRFENDVDMWNLLLYQEKIKKILYVLFVYKYPLIGVAKRWGIPQQKLNIILNDYSQNLNT